MAIRSSLIDSIKRCSLSGISIPKEELRKKITMPEYLRIAIRESIAAKDIDSGKRFSDSDAPPPPDSPVVVFINSKSGGRNGPELITRLQELMGQEQVIKIFFFFSYFSVFWGLTVKM